MIVSPRTPGVPAIRAATTLPGTYTAVGIGAVVPPALSKGTMSNAATVPRASPEGVQRMMSVNKMVRICAVVWFRTLAETAAPAGIVFHTCWAGTHFWSVPP